jgi:4-diphosphocytidyl-2-C-methyl-D-erythritol kinase
MIPKPNADGAWLAPAKLNLMLRVLGRRPDGYHRLQTVFQFIDRCDRLFFVPSQDGSVTRVSGAAGISPEQDLVTRAALALKEATGCRRGVEIRVDKQLPMGGGLGGGSSDAATTLQALNRLWEIGLDTDALAEIGLALGADVPVFVRGQAAWAEGVGEEIRPVQLDEPWYLVLSPQTQVSTAAVFADPELTRDSAPITMADFAAGDQVNDCAPVVLERYPAVNEAFRLLQSIGAVPRLTGTGACVFGTFRTQASALAAQSKMPTEMPAFVARGLNRSPLFG